MKVEKDKEPLNTEKTKTGFVKEAEDDWVDDVFLDIPYEDEIIEPIDDYVDYEAALVDNDVVYRIRDYGTRNTEWDTKKDKEEVVEIVKNEDEKEDSVKEESVKAVPVKEEDPYDDESKILPVDKQTLQFGKMI
jgi:hypothetical protein